MTAVGFALLSDPGSAVVGRALLRPEKFFGVDSAIAAVGGEREARPSRMRVGLRVEGVVRLERGTRGVDVGFHAVQVRTLRQDATGMCLEHHQR